MTRTAEQLVEILAQQFAQHGFETIPLKLEARLKSADAVPNEWRVKGAKQRADAPTELKLVFAVAEPDVAGAFEDPDMHMLCTIWINPKSVEAETEVVVVHRIAGIVQEACSADVISLALEAARIDARHSNGTATA